MADEVNLGVALLKQLRQRYPAKVSGPDLLRSVSQTEKVGIESLRPVLERLVQEGLVKAVSDGSGEERLIIAKGGIDMLDGLEPASSEGVTISPWEMESKLIATYDSMKSDMEALKKNLEQNQREFEKEMGDLRKSITDHDQFLRTYFVRIIESISVFIGIFGIVVVMMVNNLIDPLSGTDLDHLRQFVIGLPLLLIITIIPTLFIIKKMILEPRKPSVK